MGQKRTEDDLPIAFQRINKPGYSLCDRDVRLNTAIVGAGSFEDLKVDPATNLRSDWGEVSLIGVYKDDAGSMVAVADQADADANAILTVLDYQGKSEGLPIPYELRGGCFYADPATAGWDHQVYAMAAPGIPAASGGSIPFFDGYLAPYAGEWMAAINPVAMLLDPMLAAPASVLRVWCYYPAGTKVQHVMRLVTYRPPAT